MNVRLETLLQVELEMSKYYNCECFFFAPVNDLMEKREVFKHRIDKLDTKTHTMTTGLIVEHFLPGRPDCLQGIKEPV